MGLTMVNPWLIHDLVELMRFYRLTEHLWALTVRGRDLVGRGRTPRPSEGSRGVMRGRDVPRVPGRWVYNVLV